MVQWGRLGLASIVSLSLLAGAGEQGQGVVSLWASRECGYASGKECED